MAGVVNDSGIEIPVVWDSNGGTPVGGAVPSGGSVVGGVTIEPVAPIASFKATVYAGGIVGFEDTSMGYVAARLWSLGDGHDNVQSIFLHQYVGWGTFPVTLTVENSAGFSTSTQSVVIPEFPGATTVDFSFATGNLGVQLTDTSTKAGDRQWDLGDGTTSTATNPYHLYDSPGIYTVTLTISGVSKSYPVAVDYGISLNWQDNSTGESGFKIEHSLDALSWAIIDTVGAGVTSLTVTQNLHGVDPAVTNHFRVYAYDGDGNSDYSNEVETLCEG